MRSVSSSDVSNDVQVFYGIIKLLRSLRYKHFFFMVSLKKCENWVNVICLHSIGSAVKLWNLECFTKTKLYGSIKRLVSLHCSKAQFGPLIKHPTINWNLSHQAQSGSASLKPFYKLEQRDFHKSFIVEAKHVEHVIVWMCVNTIPIQR